jgi:hypothetical protein
MRKLKIVLVILIVSCSIVMEAQDAKVVVGYNMGGYLFEQNTIEAMSTRWKEELNMDFVVPNLLRGMYVGALLGSDNFTFEFGVSNKKIKSRTTTFIHPIHLKEYTYKYKLRLWTFNMGGAVRAGSWKFGLSVDAGVLNAFEKSAPTDNFNKEKWDKMYPRVYFSPGMSFIGHTVFVSKTIKESLEIRPYYQFAWSELKRGSDRYWGANYGIGIYALLGG